VARRFRVVPRAAGQDIDPARGAHGFLLGVTFAGPAWKNSSTRPPSPVVVQVPIIRPCLRPPLLPRPSARPGSACSRPTGPELGTRRRSLPRRSRMPSRTGRGACPRSTVMPSRAATLSSRAISGPMSGVERLGPMIAGGQAGRPVAGFLYERLIIHLLGIDAIRSRIGPRISQASAERTVVLAAQALVPRPWRRVPAGGAAAPAAAASRAAPGHSTWLRAAYAPRMYRACFAGCGADRRRIVVHCGTPLDCRSPSL
jgi:hypothetical protein